MAEPLISETSVSDDALRLVVAGDVDMESSGELRVMTRQPLGTAGIRQVIVDLDNVPFVDSTGIRTLLDGYLAATEQGKAFFVTKSQALVRRGARDLGGAGPADCEFVVADRSVRAVDGTHVAPYRG